MGLIIAVISCNIIWALTLIFVLSMTQNKPIIGAFKPQFPVSVKRNVEDEEQEFLEATTDDIVAVFNKQNKAAEELPENRVPNPLYDENGEEVKKPETNGVW